MLRSFSIALIVIGLCGLAILMLTSCENPAVQQARAEADKALAEAKLLVAEADNYRIKRNADIDAANEAAARRENAREAAHQRALELLPFLLVLFFGFTIILVILLIFWASVRRPETNDTFLQYMASRDKEFWSAMATLARRVDSYTEED